MKNVLSFVSVFVLIFAAFFAFGYLSTKEVRTMSSSFIHHISADEMDQAYAMMNKKFQAKVSFSVFSKQLRDGHLNTIENVYWTNYYFKDGIESAEGAITLKSGTLANFRIRVAKLEADAVYSIISYNFKGILDENEL
jgi:hypothetical protein